jgi:CheY-like chemotaxis protein
MEIAAPNKTVLLVESSSDVRLVLRDALQAEGYEVIATETVEEALPLMPHLEGLEVVQLEWPYWCGPGTERFIQSVRQLSACAALPIVLLGFERSAPLPGTQGLLLKPFRFERLLEVIADACRCGHGRCSSVWCRNPGTVFGSWLVPPTAASTSTPNPGSTTTDYAGLSALPATSPRPAGLIQSP